MNLIEIASLVIIVVAILRGGRSMWRMRQRYVNDPRRSRILRSFNVIVGTMFIIALWFAFLTVRRLLDFPPLDWTAFINIIIVAGALIGIPEYADRQLTLIERGDTGEREPREAREERETHEQLDGPRDQRPPRPPLKDTLEP